MSALQYLAVFCATIVLFKLTGKSKNRNALPLPPGPPADPLIGHLRMMPPKRQDVWFNDLAKKYGNVFYLNLLGNDFVILNGLKPAIDLLEKRSSNYSGRPRFPLTEVLDANDLLVFLDYGDAFRLHRRTIQKYLLKDSIKIPDNHAAWVNEARKIVRNWTSKPAYWNDSLNMYATAIIIDIAFGHHATDDNDPYFKLCADLCEHVVPVAKPDGGALVELIPILKYLPSWFPGGHWPGRARQCAPYARRFKDYPYVHAKEKMAEGTAKSCFMTAQIEALENGTDPDLTEEHIKAMAMMFYSGGAETTTSTLASFVAAMLLYPECQENAQKEIKMVIGNKRLPDFDDRDSLPYVECVMQEVLRWRPAVPAIPHRALEDDVYEGMFIPKGAIIVPNIPGMGLDETIYKDASMFNPSRYLPAPLGGEEPHFNDVYGFGRRICPGRHLANESLWIAIATILATVTIAKPLDDNGKEYMPEVEFESGITRSFTDSQNLELNYEENIVRIVMHGEHFAIVLLKLKSKKRNALPLPPSPPADPLVGHLRFMPPNQQDLWFNELAKKYGDVFYLNLLGNDFVILNSLKPATDLLEKRSSSYSGRPRFPLVEIIGADDMLVFLDYGDAFRLHRRAFHVYLSKDSLKTRDNHAAWTKEARNMIHGLTTHWYDSLNRYATAIIVDIGFGHQPTDHTDPYFKLCADLCEHVVPVAKPDGGALVELIPSLRFLPSWFPGGFWPGRARQCAPYAKKIKEYPYNRAKKEMAEGTAKQCFITTQLEALENGTTPGLTEDHIKAMSIMLYSGGAETTTSTLASFVAAMVLYPECQQKAQAEIKSVVGDNRLPDFDDRESLPYVECVMQEVLRWRPAVSMAIPHRALEDDVYDGMFIPKGATIIPNIRGMGLDENVYKHPSTFNPSRYLPAPSGAGEPRFDSVWGFGRRICPGRHLANESVWIAIATVLATVTIEKPINNDGKEYMPEIEFETGFTCHPLPFPCRIVPRETGSISQL